MYLKSTYSEDEGSFIVEKDKHLGLHIDRELHYKLQYVSKYDGRSISGEVSYLLRRYIADFEERHGKIELPEEKS